ncbi:MAG: hypothetical protein HKN06_05175 [Gammaproteobacteria bacterium]|nr:hypothetical protein [Gammaproteobacteria bacterium]
MTDNNLAEQLKGPFNYASRKKGEPHYLKVPESLIEACACALTPVKDEEVQNMVKALRASTIGHCPSADLIERLARDKERAEQQRDGLKHNASVIVDLLSVVDEKKCALEVWDKVCLALEFAESSSDRW